MADDDELEGIHRGWGRRLLSTGKIAASAARLAARRVVGAEGPQDAAIGETLSRELDQMKGMAMKVGQILSYFDGVLPEGTHRALQSLQRGARAISFTRMAEVIEAAFGEPVDALFDRFEREPIAAASIGQVYRARYRGREVVVKVQYPGIRETIAGDFSRLQGLAKIASLASSVDGPALVEELRARFIEECDYQLEGDHQNTFRAAFADDPQVEIPAAIGQRTRETVLTSEFCEGRDFYTFAAEASQARRDEVALCLTRFALRSLYELGMVNADPHPGNYLFPARDAVVFLDYGCVRRFDAEFLAAQRRLTRIVIEDRRADYDDALVAAGMVAKEKGFDFDLQWKVDCHLLAPYRTPRFHFTPEYVRAAMDLNRPGNPNLRRIAIPPQWIWVQRLQFGLHAVLTRLSAEGRFADAMHEALAMPRRPAA